LDSALPIQQTNQSSREKIAIATARALKEVKEIGRVRAREIIALNSHLRINPLTIS